MALVYSPNIIEIAVVQTYNARPAVNVWHMWFDAELGTDTIEDVVGDFRDNWQDHVLDLQSSGVFVQSFDWRSLDPSNNTNGTILPNGTKPTQGARAVASMPPNVAYLVHKNTSDRPRGRRDGRSFLVGVAEADVNDEGRVNSTQVTSYNAALDSFYNGISDTSGSASGDRYPAVLETTPASRAPGNATVTIGSRRVTSITLDELVATQRDRLR